jgi:hypothetical protein
MNLKGSGRKRSCFNRGIILGFASKGLRHNTENLNQYSECPAEIRTELYQNKRVNATLTCPSTLLFVGNQVEAPQESAYRLCQPGHGMRDRRTDLGFLRR